MTSEPEALWSELKASTPAIAQPPGVLSRYWAAYPGYKDWLLSQFALGLPTSSIKSRLNRIREEQDASGEQQWPQQSKRLLDEARLVTMEEWKPVAAGIKANIENVGLLSKSRRLLTLSALAEDIEERMWDERNSKTGQLYLLSDLRATLRQIAEEKGELGSEETNTESALIGIATKLVDMLNVQGSGVHGDVIEGEFSYDEPIDEPDAVSRQGGSLEAHGVQAYADPDEVPPDEK